MAIVNAIDAGALMQMYRQGVSDRQQMENRQIAMQDRQLALEEKQRGREAEAERKAIMGRLFSYGEPPQAIDESGAVSQPSYAPQQMEQPQPAAGMDTGRLFNITAQTESGNRDYANGRPVRSPKGALYAMQVMPGTNRDPGFGVRAARDNSPEESNRVGRDYLVAMKDRYGGDMAKAWAAYNWGPGNLDRAIAANGENWMQAAPEETRAYVEKNMAALGNQGAPQSPQQAEPIQLSSLPIPKAHPAYNKDAMRDLFILDADTAMKLQDHFGKVEKAEAEAFGRKNEVLGQAAQYLSSFPPAQRGQALRAVASQLVAAGWTPQEIQQADLSDNGLKGYVAMAMDVDKIIDNARADAQFDETRRHNRVTEGNAQSALGLAREREGRIAKGGSATGDFSGSTTDTLLGMAGIK